MSMIGLRDGGWVLIGAGMLFIAIIIWATAPAVLRMVERPPGDGKDIASYAFDLSNARLPASAIIEPAMLHRDMVPVLDAPVEILDASTVVDLSETRGKYLVDGDTVIGVSIDGESRAYPISMLNVHEMVHDDIAGTPVLVTWHWPSASPRVFNRTIAGTPTVFGVSGLMAGGNLTFYPRRPNGEVGGEPLYSQLLGRTITGPAHTLTPIPSALTSWQAWRKRHPETTVAGRDAALKKRYKHADPGAYYISGGLISQTTPPDEGPPPKAPVLLLDGADARPVWVTEDGFSTAGDWKHVPGGKGTPPRIECPACPPQTDLRHALWHAVHALGLGSDPAPTMNP